MMSAPTEQQSQSRPSNKSGPWSSRLQEAFEDIDCLHATEGQLDSNENHLLSFGQTGSPLVISIKRVCSIEQEQISSEMWSSGLRHLQNAKKPYEGVESCSDGVHWIHRIGKDSIRDVGFLFVIRAWGLKVVPIFLHWTHWTRIDSVVDFLCATDLVYVSFEILSVEKRLSTSGFACYSERGHGHTWSPV